ncbi:MAG: flagellar hook-length control protein FliK [Gammaproteobacteria bacterium]|nr:flagellar hook-length control protein FliK [Gammaproteobacteria bacterium]
MNQNFVLKADSMTVTTKAVGQQHEINTRSNSKDEARKAFSSELDKQIDKHERPKAKAESHVKEPKSQDIQPKGKDVEKRQTEESDSKDGNTLPDEQSIEGEISVQIADEIIESPAVIDVVEQEVEIQPEQTTQYEANPVTLTANITAEPKADEVVVKIDEGKPVQAADSKSNKQTSNLNLESKQPIEELDKKIPKSLRTNIESAENKRIIDVAAHGMVSDNHKQQELQPDHNKVSTKIRPDILHALTKNQQDGGEKLANVLNKEQPIMTNKVLANSLIEGRQMAESINQVKPGLQLTGKAVEHGVGNLVTALTPAATLTQGVTTAVAPTTSTSQASLDIQPSVQSQAWNRVLSSRVIWMAREGIQRAELKLNPANLGPVEVRLNMHNDQANVTFIAHHATTRDALEQALPKLRDSFMENGFELTDANVSQHDFEQAASDEQNEKGNAESSQSTSVDERDGESIVNIDYDDDTGLSVYA